MEKTRLSTKGQIIVPKAIRTSRAWGPGTEFAVEGTKLEDVAGCLKTNRKRPATLAEMDAAIVAEVRARHARGQY